MLAFLAFVPWLRALDRQRSLAGALLSACAMSIAYTAAVFAWFGSAIGSYTQLGTAAGMSVLLVAAPLFQPQFLAFALVRHVVGRCHGPALRALAAAAAWVAAESLVPRLLGDSFGYGLYPSRLLRQAADVGGVAGLTLLLLLANEGVSAAVARRREGPVAVARPLALAALVPLLLAAYGLAALSLQPGDAPALRVALVQSNIVDYERLRRERGAGAVAREVLDAHFSMSWDAVERQRADAVLWSETVYPTTFGRPKSEAGAELDRQILQTMAAAGVPFVFGTYDRDAAGEYNAAAFVAPGKGLVGVYRKTRPFPLTEYVPAWLDGPALRRWLPWAGTWQPGTGARVLPLQLRDGREVPVLPMICLDDMDPGLAIDGARLGAQAILTMSNDAWFSNQPLGAKLHLAAAAFRSIETRLPQFRVTTNGYSAVIDASGTVIAGAAMGQRTLVVGSLPVREPPRTLMTLWGDWVGRAAAAFLVLLAVAAALRALWAVGATGVPAAEASPLARDVIVLPPAARLAAGLLRAFARLSLLGMAAAVVFGEGPLQGNPLAQIRTFAALVLAPEAAAWCLLRAFSARLAIAQGLFVLVRGRQRLELAVRTIAAVEPWRIPVPAPGASLRLAEGGRWRYGIALADPAALARALRAVGGAWQETGSPRASQYAHARCATAGGRLQHLAAKFVLLPLALAVPAFRLHQHIAYGSSFGEYHAFGPLVYLKGFALWWATWIVIVALCAAVLRVAIEGGTVAALFLRPAATMEIRRWLERIGLAALYLGLPAWLLSRMLVA